MSAGAVTKVSPFYLKSDDLFSDHSRLPSDRLSNVLVNLAIKISTLSLG